MIRFVIIVIVCTWSQSIGGDKSSRHADLQNLSSSSTSGKGNVYLSAHGRTFLWDNGAANKLPSVLPHLEIRYGALEWLDIIGGVQMLFYGLSPGRVYGKLKLTAGEQRNIRLLGFGLEAEISKNLFSDFPSNGYRIKDEGFGPEGYVPGGDSFLSFWKVNLISDFEGIRLSPKTPFKLYLNTAYSDGFDSHIQKVNRSVQVTPDSSGGSDHFGKLQMGIGMEWKTAVTDFFLELNGDYLASSMGNYLINGSKWTRYQIGDKVFDMHLMENPMFTTGGARMKYSSGFEMQGAITWMLSMENGPQLGACRSTNVCRDGATDGYSPFYPQWLLSAKFKFPLKYVQTSSEMYRAFLLKKNQAERATLDLDKSIQQEKEKEEKEQRRKRLEERRKKALERIGE